MSTTTYSPNSSTPTTMQARPGTYVPALKGHQGDRPMYLLLVSNNMLLRNFAAEAEVVDGTAKVQRTLDKKHSDDIVNYIVDNPSDYILGAMTYAIDVVNEETDFQPAMDGSPIGLLLLPMDARLRCLDGQHRRAAIAKAVADDHEVGEDFSAVVLYVEDDYTKRRQMFSDMNATPKVVSKALNITFDSRDPYAQAAQRLSSEHPLLQGVVETTKARINAADPNVFSLSGVYDALKRFDLGMILPRGRSPKDKSVDDLVAIGAQLFDVIAAARPEFEQIKASLTDEPEQAGKLMKDKRRSTLLMSTTTLRVIAGALHMAMTSDDESDVENYRGRLASIDFTPTSGLFTDKKVNFVGNSGTPSARNQEVHAATKALADALRLTRS